jgi:TonB family protein
MFRVLFHHILPFVLGIFVGVTVFYMFAPTDVPVPPNASASPWGVGSGRGLGSGGGSGWHCPMSGHPERADAESTTPVRIVSKPRALYTDLARQNQTEGSVVLKVTLLASGEIGGISVVRGLPDGLTERAMAAARQIKFQPERVNGVPVSVTKTVEYTFSIY